MKRNLKKITKHFGKEHQKEKLREECEEFLAEPYDKSEIADVWVLAEQLRLADKEINNIIRQKIKRTLQRIKTGYYEETK